MLAIADGMAPTLGLAGIYGVDHVVAMRIE
jgi:hypothetical protein